MATVSIEDTQLNAVYARLEELEADLQAARRLLGYVITDRGDDGELLVGARTVLEHDNFILTSEQMPSGALRLTAIPA